MQVNNTQDGVTTSKGYVNPNTASASDAVQGKCGGTTDCSNVLPDVSNTKSMYFLIDVCGNEAIVEPQGTCADTGVGVGSPCTLIPNQKLNNDQW